MNAIILAQVNLNQIALICCFFLGRCKGRPYLTLIGWFKLNTRGDLVCSANSQALIFQQPLRRRSCMRLRFKNHVERLAREGLGPAAYTCWMHGIEVLHSPYVITTGTDSEMFPPCRKCPAALMDVHVAQLMWVGSSSRGLSCGIAGELCCLMMWRLRMLGSTTTSTKNPWISCWSRHTRISRWPMTWCPKSSMDSSSDVQRG